MGWGLCNEGGAHCPVCEVFSVLSACTVLSIVLIHSSLPAAVPACLPCFVCSIVCAIIMAYSPICMRGSWPPVTTYTSTLISAHCRLATDNGADTQGNLWPK